MHSPSIDPLTIILRIRKITMGGSLMMRAEYNNVRQDTAFLPLLQHNKTVFRLNFVPTLYFSSHSPIADFSLAL